MEKTTPKQEPIKEKTKLSFLPFNLIYSFLHGMMIFVMLSTFCNFSNIASLVISISFYLNDVNKNTLEDYLNYKIKNLEEKIK